ncbi:MFS transporter [Ideonella sp. 3Y2]|uniref:MFS transporter n=1 Tax=Ideonella alba TaxID=2824118 RepID=A0A941BKV6_9BURK|nr:MFS transporter [Ideonella alba]
MRASRSCSSASGCRHAPPSPRCAAPCWDPSPRRDERTGPLHRASARRPEGRPVSAAADAGAGWRYGLLGAPVAFASVPLYVHLPHHYAQTLGWPLAALGTLLLASRLADALIDPLLGRWVDRLHARSPGRVLAFGAGAAVVMALTMWLLFFPPWPAALQWPGAALTLLLACASASALAIAHQGWGARLGGDALQRGRIVAWREGLGLAGVLAASVTPELAGYAASLALCALLLGMGWWAWTAAPRPQPVAAADAGDWRRPWQQAAFRRLLAVFALNGIASAIPATLVLFYIADRLQAAAPWPGLLLAAYFGAAAAALPLWLRAVARWGLARSWMAGMGLSILAFIGAAALDAGDAPWFLAVCLAAGAALGADLALPGALLSGVIGRAGDRGRHDGAYVGWWQVVTKLNLALAAGAVLPLLAALGYQPGERDPAALAWLAAVYALLPCALKALAALLLWRLWAAHPEDLA